MMNLRHRVLATIAAVLMLALSATGVAAGPSQPGASPTTDAGLATCDLKVALRGGTPVDTSVTAGIGQEVELHGFGFPPDTDINIVIVRVGQISGSAEAARTDGAGNFLLVGYFWPGSEGLWEIRAPSDGLAACGGYDVVNVEVVTGHPFTDIGGHLFEAEITWLYQRAITTGCAAAYFCPDAAVTREQMASFLVRALELPATTSDFFTDDETSIHEDDINRLAASGITAGCTSTTFCPTASVTRGQMAAFLERALF